MIKHGMAAAYDAKLTLIFTAILAGGCAAYQRFGAATGGGGAGPRWADERLVGDVGRCARFASTLIPIPPPFSPRSTRDPHAMPGLPSHP